MSEGRGLARVVLIALAGSVVGRWIASFLLGVLEPILLGLGPVDPVPQGWAGSFPALAGGFLPPWLLGSFGGAALTLHLILRGSLERRRARQALAVVATLAGLASWQVLVRTLGQPSLLVWTSALGLGLVAAILGGAAANPKLPRAEELGGRRRAWTIVLLATLLLGVPTLTEAWARHSPKDYPDCVIELVVSEGYSSSAPELPGGPGDSAPRKVVRLESGDLLLVRQPSQELVEIHLSWRKAGEFLDLTRRNIGQPVSVRIDGEEVMRPVIRGPIAGGKLVIAPGTGGSASPLFERLRGAAK